MEDGALAGEVDFHAEESVAIDSIWRIGPTETADAVLSMILASGDPSGRGRNPSGRGRQLSPFSRYCGRS